MLVIGVADQSLDGAVPDYAEVAATFSSDQAFFGDLEAQLPDGAMVFQLPFRDFPESAKINGTTESDQLRPFLNTTTLRWSAGGIKGRPQVDWAQDVADQPAERMTRQLAVIGFVGIVVDREATSDHGTSWEYDLMPYTGAPTSISPDGRWAYYSLARVGLQVRTTMSPATRQAMAAVDHRRRPGHVELTGSRKATPDGASVPVRPTWQDRGHVRARPTRPTPPARHPALRPPTRTTPSG